MNVNTHILNEMKRLVEYVKTLNEQLEEAETQYCAQLYTLNERKKVAMWLIERYTEAKSIDVDDIIDVCKQNDERLKKNPAIGMDMTRLGENGRPGKWTRLTTRKSDPQTTT